MPSTMHVPHSLNFISKEQSHLDLNLPLSSSPDVDLQALGNLESNPQSAIFKSLGLLDRFLAIWILLAMVIGILLGNFVPSTGPALQKGQFVGVSIPIGQIQRLVAFTDTYADICFMISNWIARYDVSNLV